MLYKDKMSNHTSVAHGDHYQPAVRLRSVIMLRDAQKGWFYFAELTGWSSSLHLNRLLKRRPLPAL